MKRKIISLCTLMLAVVMSVFILVSCGGGNVKASVAEATETLVVIKIEKTDEKATLLDAMEALKEDEKLSFDISAGMITSINGKANAADYSSCWMLYTSDSEMANAAWAIEYDGKMLGSAVVGAETLTVVEGEYYVWSYQTF